MSNLPISILEYIYDLSLDTHSLAYLLVNKDGEIIDYGGRLDNYGFDDIDKESKLDNGLSFLNDLLPTENETISFSNVSISGNVVADIHLIPEDDSIRIMFLDANKNALQMSLFKQTANDLKLISEKKFKNDVSSDNKKVEEIIDKKISDLLLFSKLFSLLNVAVFERDDENKYEVVGIFPKWLYDFYPDIKSENLKLDISERFLFLENFIVDADSIWSGVKADHMKSGVWTEVDLNGEEHHLEATAINIIDRNFLLIEKSFDSSENQSILIQKAREKDLYYNNLNKEIQKKDILINCIIHDLNSPLSIIKNCLSLIEIAEEEIYQKFKNYIDISMQQIDKLEAMIIEIYDIFSNDIEALNLARLSLLDSNDLTNLFNELVNDFKVRFERKNINLLLESDLSDESNWKIKADKPRLQRVVSNLLENAFRYSPDGSDTYIKIESNDDLINFSIHDQGPGIDKSGDINIFVPYLKGVYNSGVMGVGLYFCKTTIETWGGSIEYTRSDDGVSIFSFYLPKVIENISNS